MAVEAYFQDFLAVNLHFKRSGNYDYFKYKGKVRVDPTKVHHRKDRFAIAYFEKSESSTAFRDRVVAYNFYEGKNPWSAIELKRPQAKEFATKWSQQNNNLKKNVLKDLKEVDNMRDYVIIKNGAFLPDILNDVIGERISPHTFMSVNRVLKLTDTFYDKHYGDNMIYHNAVFLLKKASPFVMIDKTVEELIKEKL